MIRKTGFFLLGLLQVFMAFPQETYFSDGFEFKPGMTVYLLGNDVKLRSKPSTDAEVIKLLKIGAEAVIIEKTRETLVIAGQEKPWYKINQGGQPGYVWGGLISLTMLKDKTNGDAFFLFGLNRKENKLFLETRYVVSGEQKAQLSFPLIGYEFSLEALGTKGCNNIDNILMIDYIAEACGVEGGESYVFLNKEKLYHIKDMTSYADAEYGESNALIFPNDPEGRKGLIIHHYSGAEDEGDDYIEKTSTRFYKWDDGKLRRVNPHLQDQ